MIRTFNLLAVIIMFSCSQQYQTDDIGKQSTKDIAKYPAIVESMGLQDKYDIAKWSLYCIYCDDTVKLRKSKINFAKTFGNLELKFTGLEKKNDSVELNFYFYIDSIPCSLENVESFGNKFFSNGVLFVKDSLAFYTTPTTIRYFRKEGSQNRFFKPLQPEVVTFIQNNKDKLAPWFREEARRRKLIE